MTKVRAVAVPLQSYDKNSGACQLTYAYNCNSCPSICLTFYALLAYIPHGSRAVCDTKPQPPPHPVPYTGLSPAEAETSGSLC